MENYYGPLVTPDGQKVYIPKSLMQYALVVPPELFVAQPPMYAPMHVSQPPVMDVNVAPVSFPEFVEQAEPTITSVRETETYEKSYVEIETTTKTESFEISSDLTEYIAPVVTDQHYVDELIEAVVDLGETQELEMPQMVKKATIEHDDIDDNASVSSAATASTDLNCEVEFPAMQITDKEDESDSGDLPMMTRDLPVYITKVPLRVREDCMNWAPMTYRVEANTRVHVLENGIEKFPVARVCHWWRQTFEGMDSVIDNIRQHEIDGRKMADFAWDTQRQLNLSPEETQIVKKGLALVSRKSQILFEQDGQMCRGWVSKVKRGKAQMSRVFTKSKPTLVVSRMDNAGRTLKECGDRMVHTLEALNLEYEAIEFSKYFEGDRMGKDFIYKRGRGRYHGNWKPRNHCLIEFETHRDAAVALKKLAGFSAYPEDFDYTQGYALYARSVSVAFAKEYANLETMTFPRY